MNAGVLGPQGSSDLIEAYGRALYFWVYLFYLINILNALNKTRIFISGMFWVESGDHEPKAHFLF